MKKLITCITSFLLYISAHTGLTQTKPATTNHKVVNDVFVSVEKLPEFPGGLNKFFEFVKSNIHKPAVPANTPIFPRTNITFIVERNGELTNIKPVGRFTDAYAKEAVHVMKLSPKWIPGKQNNKPVRVQYVVPIVFN